MYIFIKRFAVLLAKLRFSESCLFSRIVLTIKSVVKGLLARRKKISDKGVIIICNKTEKKWIFITWFSDVLMLWIQETKKKTNLFEAVIGPSKVKCKRERAKIISTVC